MLTIYSRRVKANRRTMIATHASVIGIDASPDDVRIVAREHGSDVEYTIHMAPEEVASLASIMRGQVPLDLPRPPRADGDVPPPPAAGSDVDAPGPGAPESPAAGAAEAEVTGAGEAEVTDSGEGDAPGDDLGATARAEVTLPGSAGEPTGGYGLFRVHDAQGRPGALVDLPKGKPHPSEVGSLYMTDVDAEHWWAACLDPGMSLRDLDGNEYKRRAALPGPPAETLSSSEKHVVRAMLARQVREATSRAEANALIDYALQDPAQAGALKPDDEKALRAIAEGYGDQGAATGGG